MDGTLDTSREPVRRDDTGQWTTIDAAAPAQPEVRQTECYRAPSDRRGWLSRRAYMEEHNEKRTADGRRRTRHWPIFKFLIKKFGMLLRVAGFYERGVRNALDLRLNRYEFSFANLPEAFDGFTILHLTDLHFDGLEALEDKLVEVLSGLEVDVCAFTGDYRFRVHGPFEHIMPTFDRVIDAVKARHGYLAVLGNHDTVEMVPHMEERGIEILANERLTFRRGDQELHFLGIDDVHYYYTEHATRALFATPEGFTVALVHSPEIVEETARAGASLYLTGHTHGGQICLPGGIPILTNIARRAYASGVWRCGDMVGLTSTGSGISGLPVRFNSRGEAALITLRRAAG